MDFRSSCSSCCSFPSPRSGGARC
uniref:Uncharacterized protein n=1 Tax=Lotus japonicus TaxID=34305 RepID=I3SWB1_LOTJA|nr:unknown [Lotus japonicus]